MKRFVLLSCLLSFSGILFAGVLDKKEKFTYDSKGKRDPFFAVEEQKQGEAVTAAEPTMTPKEKLAKKGIVVTSIVWDPRKPAVLIGDSILEEGDTIQGVIIRNIEKEYVVFEVDGELIELPMA